MRRATLLATLLLCCSAAYAYADLGNQGPVLPPKGYGDTPQPVIQEGGETFATATVIPGLPYTDSGNTCDNIHDYALTCPANTAKDVVYTFRPTADICVTIETCTTLPTYDTMLGVFANNPATQIACNDDACGLQSRIATLALTAGNTYYIVVDGFSSACGNYYLSVNQVPCPPPPPPPAPCECPAGSIAEGEPNCFDNYVDTYNGGCNSTPPVFTNLPCNDDVLNVCGTYGNYLVDGTQNFRDTDWYQINVTAPTGLQVAVNGPSSNGNATAILDDVCPPLVICFNATTASCASAVCAAPLAPGSYYIFAATAGFVGVPCGTRYVLQIRGNTCPPTSAEVTSWGKLKSIYR